VKRISAILPIAFVVSLVFHIGCEPESSDPKVAVEAPANPLRAYASYMPTKVRIMPLTEFALRGDDTDQQSLKVYVTLLDSFGSQVKAPVTFRFELYEYVERSAVAKGRRLAIWPDIDLNDAAENNSFWRDYLRAYEFDLDFDPQLKQGYILQATCMSPLGKRLSTDFKITHKK